jgi:hypothetical protein
MLFTSPLTWTALAPSAAALAAARTCSALLPATPLSALSPLDPAPVVELSDGVVAGPDGAVAEPPLVAVPAGVVDAVVSAGALCAAVEPLAALVEASSEEPPQAPIATAAKTARAPPLPASARLRRRLPRAGTLSPSECASALFSSSFRIWSPSVFALEG